MLPSVQLRYPNLLQRRQLKFNNMDHHVLARTPLPHLVLLYFLFFSTTYTTRTEENITISAISTSTLWSAGPPTDTNFTNISNTISNQGELTTRTIALDVHHPTVMHAGDLFVDTTELSTFGPTTTNGTFTTTKMKEIPRLYVEITNNFTGELYVGMKIDVVLTAVYTKGMYEQIKLLVNPLSQSTDVSEPACSSGEDITSDSVGLVVVPHQEDSGFVRNLMTGYLRSTTNISEGHAVDERTEVCEVTIFFHNAENIEDGENVTTSFILTMTDTKKTQTLRQFISFVARTSLPENNKIAFFDVNLSFPAFIINEKNKVTKVQFTHWIPFYRPLLSFKIYEESKLMLGSVLSMYLRIVAVGAHFYPGVTWWNLNRVCHFPEVESGVLTMTLPIDWVNRGYHYSRTTTGEDAIYFEAGVTLSESACAGVNYTFRLHTSMNGKEVWNSTLTMAAKQVLSNATAEYKCSMRRLYLEELYPSSKTSVLLAISVPKMRSDILNLNISTKPKWGENSSLIIQHISVNNEVDNTLCTLLNTSYRTDNDSGQHMAFVTLHFINSADSFIDILILINITVNTGTFGDTSVITVEFSNYVNEMKISLNSPLLLLGTHGNLSSQLSRLVDGNQATCIALPNQGDKPPCLWMKLNTMWLKIASKPFCLTVVGDNITCKSHGQRLLQVYYPVERGNLSSEEDFPKQFAACELMSENVTKHSDLIECQYQCQCNKPTECEEVILFMADKDETASWRLCELIAQNIDGELCN